MKTQGKQQSDVQKKYSPDCFIWWFQHKKKLDGCHMLLQQRRSVIHKPLHILSFNYPADSLWSCIMSSGWPAVLCPGLFLEAPHNNSRIITPQNDEETSKRALWLHPFSSQTSFKALGSYFLTARDDRMKQIDSWRVLGQLTSSFSSCTSFIYYECQLHQHEQTPPETPELLQ